MAVSATPSYGSYRPSASYQSTAQSLPFYRAVAVAGKVWVHGGNAFQAARSHGSCTWSNCNSSRTCRTARIALRTLPWLCPSSTCGCVSTPSSLNQRSAIRCIVFIAFDWNSSLCSRTCVGPSR